MVSARQFIFGCAALILSASGFARTITVCIPSNPFPPLTFTDHEGQGQWLVRKAVERQGDAVRFESVPWKRCTEGVVAGAYEAAMPPSAKFLPQMAFPMAGAEADARKSFGTVTMAVLRRVGSKAHWDGKAFTSLNTPVLYNKNIVSVKEKLATLGIAGDEGAHVNESLLRKLLAGRGELLIMNEQAAMEELAQPEYKGQLEILPVPFLTFTLYVAFNREFHAANTAFVEAVWTEIARLRSTPEWARIAPSLAK
jgi:polar amino acid transport system substrate-binding protein